jgi:O-antigen ligase
MAVFAFSLPLSIAVSQSVLILGLLGWAVKICLGKKINWERTPLDYPILIFLTVGFLSAFWGADWFNSLAGLRTFWTFLVVYILYNNVYDYGRVKVLMSSLLAGAVVYASYYLVISVRELLSGTPPDLLGDMTKAGQLMIISGLAGACLLYKKRLKGIAAFSLLLALFSAAVLLQFKRGAWAALFCVFLVQAAIKSPKKGGILILAFLCLLAVFPPVRSRLSHLKEEISPESGRRTAMWMAAPEIIRDYPLGAGLDNAGELMYEYNPSIELREGNKKHTHLHNSYLNILVEMGPLGLAAFVWIIVVLLSVSYKLFRDIPEKYPFEKAFALGVFSSFTGFLINGLVEDNFGDSEVRMLLLFLAGLIFILDRRRRPV